MNSTGCIGGCSNTALLAGDHFSAWIRMYANSSRTDGTGGFAR